MSLFTLRALTLLSFLTPHVLSAPAASSPLVLPAALSLPNVPIGQLNGSFDSNCATARKYPSWSAGGDWEILDCYSAVHQLYLKEALLHKDELFEFVSKGGSARKPELTSQRTPRKYVVRSCVLTIMMLEWFPAGTLPDTRSYPWAQNDVSTYKKIYNVAKGIESQCIERQAPGWAQLGDESAMGVFLWGVNSEINDMTGGFPVVREIGGSVNATTATESLAVS